MSKPVSCVCNSAPRIVFPCSGSSDVGELADQAARELARRGMGKMFCLAGIGGRVSGLVASARAAEAILAIDGCPLGCAGKTLEQGGIDTFASLQLANLGFVKGRSPVSPEAIREVAAKAAAALVQAPSRTEPA